MTGHSARRRASTSCAPCSAPRRAALPGAAPGRRRPWAGRRCCSPRSTRSASCPPAARCSGRRVPAGTGSLLPRPARRRLPAAARRRRARRRCPARCSAGSSSGPPRLRRVWHAAQLALAAWAAAQAYALLGGPAALGGRRTPRAVAPTSRTCCCPPAAAALAFCLVAHRPRRRHPGHRRARCRRAPPGAGCSPRSLAPHLRARARRADDGGAVAQPVRAGRGALRAAADVHLLLGLRPVPPRARRPPGHHPGAGAGRRHQGPLHPRPQRTGRAAPPC